MHRCILNTIVIIYCNWKIFKLQLLKRHKCTSWGCVCLVPGYVLWILFILLSIVSEQLLPVRDNQNMSTYRSLGVVYSRSDTHFTSKWWMTGLLAQDIVYEPFRTNSKVLYKLIFKLITTIQLVVCWVNLLNYLYPILYIEHLLHPSVPQLVYPIFCLNVTEWYADTTSTHK